MEVFIYETEKAIVRIHENGRIFNGGKVTDEGKVVMENAMRKFYAAIQKASAAKAN